MTMGQRIHDLRIQHKMSMEDLAKHLGVGRSAIFKYEKGQVENLPRSTIEKMAILFGVSPSYLMCFDQWEENEHMLSDDVKLIERIQAKWGKDVVKIIQNYCELNELGKKLMVDMSSDFCDMNKFKK